MTQNGGFDILFAWCAFAIILAILGWLVLRHHRDTRAEIRRKDPFDAPEEGDESARE